MNIVKKIENILREAGIAEYKKETDIIVQEISGLTKAELLIAQEIKNTDKMLEIAAKRAKTKKPIQYILGYSYFINEKYKVNENVLIPRDETEILVGECCKLLKNKEDEINVLDIGIGSGCISCSIAKKLNKKDIEILGIDVSVDALEIALENINKLDLVRKIIVRKSDLFSKIKENEKFDLIVSNPPYIPISDKNTLQIEVNFEPDLALFAPDKNGIEYYQKIIKDAPKYLKKEGYLAFEIGIKQAKLIKEMLQKDFEEITIIKDLAKIDRVITAKLKY